MFITYTPKGTTADAKPQRWSHIPSDMMSFEQDLVEKHTGTTFAAWTMDVLNGSAKARRVLLWLLLRREHPTIRFADVDFRWSELTVELSRQEIEATLSHGAEARDDNPGLAKYLDGLKAALESADDDPDADPNQLPYVE